MSDKSTKAGGLCLGSQGPLRAAPIRAVEAMMRERVAADVVERPDVDEQRFMEARNDVSDEELVARMNAAPDMGGQQLVQLAAFLERR